MAKYRCKVIKMVLKISSEISLDKNMQHIATSQPVYIEIQTALSPLGGLTCKKKKKINWLLRNASIHRRIFPKSLWNSCSSLDAFKPQFKDGLYVLITYASLKSKMSQLYQRYDYNVHMSTGVHKWRFVLSDYYFCWHALL